MFSVHEMIFTSIIPGSDVTPQVHLKKRLCAVIGSNPSTDKRLKLSLRSFLFFYCITPLWAQIGNLSKRMWDEAQHLQVSFCFPMIVSGNLGWLHKCVQVYTHNLIALFFWIFGLKSLKLCRITSNAEHGQALERADIIHFFSSLFKNSTKISRFR